jgi:hypothetical protein
MSRLLSLFAVAVLLSTPAQLLAEDAEFVDMLAAGDLSEWVPEGKHTNNGEPIWTLADGVLHCAGSGYGFLRYDHKLGDFVWKLEYRMTKGCNSGLGIRHAKYTGGGSRPSTSGYELQILDDAGKNPATHGSMSLYRYVAPSENTTLPAGEWNTVEITCQGPHIRVVQNGKVVHDFDQTEIEKLKNKPTEGYISVQNHNKTIEYRNVLVKELK